jgi:hypothetical protein
LLATGDFGQAETVAQAIVQEFANDLSLLEKVSQKTSWRVLFLPKAKRPERRM